MPEGLQQALSDRTNPCGNLPAWGIPPPRRCRGTPLWQGGLCPKHLLHRSNDTGRVREVTNRRKPPCEIGCGHCPPATRRSSLPEGAMGGCAYWKRRKTPDFRVFPPLLCFFKPLYGSFTVKRQPVSRFSTATWPPRVVRICFTRASPRPLPSA